jgi:hypothetical protein
VLLLHVVSEDRSVFIATAFVSFITNRLYVLCTLFCGLRGDLREALCHLDQAAMGSKISSRQVPLHYSMCRGTNFRRRPCSSRLSKCGESDHPRSIDLRMGEGRSFKLQASSPRHYYNDTPHKHNRHLLFLTTVIHAKKQFVHPRSPVLLTGLANMIPGAPCFHSDSRNRCCTRGRHTGTQNRFRRMHRLSIVRERLTTIWSQPSCF